MNNRLLRGVIVIVLCFLLIGCHAIRKSSRKTQSDIEAISQENTQNVVGAIKETLEDMRRKRIESLQQKKTQSSRAQTHQ